MRLYDATRHTFNSTAAERGVFIKAARTPILTSTAVKVFIHDLTETLNRRLLYAG
jgi:hypothetical protein